LGETRGRYWRVEVLDRNDPALPRLQISLLTTPRHILFRWEPGHTYKLLYGNDKATAPQYSLARLLDNADLDSASPAKIGAEAALPAEMPVIPWTERYSFILWVAVGLAVAALGAVAVRAMQKSP
jgi:hypothetical protein